MPYPRFFEALLFFEWPALQPATANPSDSPAFFFAPANPPPCFFPFLECALFRFFFLVPPSFLFLTPNPVSSPSCCCFISVLPFHPFCSHAPSQTSRLLRHSGFFEELVPFFLPAWTLFEISACTLVTSSWLAASSKVTHVAGFFSFFPTFQTFGSSRLFFSFTWGRRRTLRRICPLGVILL